jgi:hypothetical protein
MTKQRRIFDVAEWYASIDRVIAKRFSASFMSDAKWRRLFTALAQPELALRQVLWKFVDLERSLRFVLPDADDIEQGVVPDPAGKSPFKRIEWVEILDLDIPTGWEQVPHKHRRQNVDAALAALVEVGQFETEQTQDGFRVYGYR